MRGKKSPSKKAITAIQLVNQGMTPTQAMLKAGYSKSTARNPKNNLLTKPSVVSIIDTMKTTLQDKNITGVYLASKLAEFATSDNPKVFAMAYDRIGKILGIEPSQGDLAKTPVRQVTFTEWVSNAPTPEPVAIETKENNDDLIALDNIKLDRFSEAIQENIQEIPQPISINEYKDNIMDSEPLAEMIY